MEIAFIALLASGLISSQTVPPESPTKIQATCTEHVLSEPTTRISDWPKKAQSGEINAYVVIEYALDGSGKAVNATVVDSSNRGMFNELTLKRLSEATFTAGVNIEKCVYVGTYQKVRRR